MLKMKKNNQNELKNSNELKDMKDTESAMKSTNDSAEEVLESINGKDAPSLDINEAIQAEKSSEKKDVEAELEKKIKEIETLTDTMKRRQADFENYKKRMSKIQDEQKKLAIKDFALEIINIYDDVLRAFDAACNINKDQSVDKICNTFSEGYMLLSKRIEEALHKFGIDEIDSLNKDFDPTCNEAIETDESGDVENETVTKIHQKGFRLDDTVIRAARVKVTKPKKTVKNSDCDNGNKDREQENPVSG